MNRTLIRGGHGLGAAFCSHEICHGDVDSRCCVLPRPQLLLTAVARELSQVIRHLKSQHLIPPAYWLFWPR
jgi:hypothetical protein